MVGKGGELPTLAPEHHTDEVSSAPVPGRVLRRRKGLPDSRAMLGALLVAAAVVGIFAAYSGPRGASRAYVVAARAIRPGDPFTPGDLTRTRVDLPPALRARRVHRIRRCSSARSALSPIEAGELVQTGQVIRKGRSPHHGAELPDRGEPHRKWSARR